MAPGKIVKADTELAMVQVTRVCDPRMVLAMDPVQNLEIVMERVPRETGEVDPVNKA